MDAIDNFFDQLALVCLYLAFVRQQGVSRNLIRSANLLNTVGMLTVGGLLVWHAIQRLIAPTAVQGIVPIATGLVAVGANWGVARLLWRPAKFSAAVRLAYVHNLGDVWLSLAPVLTGVLVTALGRPVCDPIVALLIAAFFIWSALRAVIASREKLVWPEKLSWDHGAETDAGPQGVPPRGRNMRRLRTEAEAVHEPSQRPSLSVQLVLPRASGQRAQIGASVASHHSRNLDAGLEPISAI
jgi:cobalt-zinc-cadmium efflux system protein